MFLWSLKTILQIRKISFGNIKIKIFFFLAFLTFASCLFYLYPTWKSVRAKGEEIAVLQGNIKERHLYISKAEEKGNQFTELEESVVLLKSYLYSENSLDEMLMELEGLLINPYLKVQSMEIGEIKPTENNYACLAADVYIQGTRGEILDYIESIEYSPRLFRIEKISFNREEEQYSGYLCIKTFLISGSEQ